MSKKDEIVVTKHMAEKACETIFGPNWKQHIDAVTMGQAIRAALMLSPDNQ